LGTEHVADATIDLPTGDAARSAGRIADARLAEAVARITSQRSRAIPNSSNRFDGFTSRCKPVEMRFWRDTGP
jgi:hypothetical protein